MGWSGGPNKKDREWWLHYGPIFVQRWMDWKREKGWRIATLPDGNPGIELGFEFEIDGLRVVGYIDRVFLMEDGSILVVDLKMGNTPAGSLQLATYGVGIAEQYGLDADWGAFWGPGGEDGAKLSFPVDLSTWSHQRMTGMYRSAMRGIEAGVFLPQVSMMCKGCVVRDYCWAVAGDKAGEIPAEFEILDPSTGEVMLDGAKRASEGSN